MTLPTNVDRDYCVWSAASALDAAMKGCEAGQPGVADVEVRIATSWVELLATMDRSGIESVSAPAAPAAVEEPF